MPRVFLPEAHDEKEFIPEKCPVAGLPLRGFAHAGSTTAQYYPVPGRRHGLAGYVGSLLFRMPPANKWLTSAQDGALGPHGGNIYRGVCLCHLPAYPMQPDVVHECSSPPGAELDPELRP